MQIDPQAGKPATPAMLVDVPRLVSAYFTNQPIMSQPGQRVSFGTSGHRGSSLDNGFNELHILAITQAICLYRQQQGVDGPLFLGIDTHALSIPACASVLEVLAAHGVDVILAEGEEYTPTPVISHAILVYNRGRRSGLADGIVITPSHNPPREGGIKYNLPNGGPAGTKATEWIERRANELLEANMNGLRRIPLSRALSLSTTHRHDFMSAYIADLSDIVDLQVVRDAKIRLGVDPLGGAGVHYWGRIAERYALDLTVVDEQVDPTFRFMSVDWDGQIRMDPSSPYAMQRLIALKDRFDLSFACDTDHDRHGIVAKSVGLLPPNHYLCVAISYLFSNRPEWSQGVAIGKTVVSSQLIDRVASSLKRTLFEVPVGFKWFSDGLFDGRLGFAGEESAGASFLRRSGKVWTTDKDGIVPVLLAAEITARMRRDPGELYQAMTHELGEPVYQRVDIAATPEQKERLKKLSTRDVRSKELAGEVIRDIQVQAPGNGAPLAGVKVQAEHGWFAARPSGTEDIYKIYAESFKGPDHLQQIIEAAQHLVADALASPAAQSTLAAER